jgi:hypothetical protein
LICAEDATITDWTPIHQPWVTVEGCSCGGYFIAKILWDQSVPRMLASERQELAEHLRTWRARGVEAWVAPVAGRRTDVLIMSQRPELDFFAVRLGREPSASGSVLASAP